MSTLRMTGDLRRGLILSAAKRCFARHGFAGTTTKSVAAAASISEGLLFKHFPTKAALHAAILTEACEADPGLVRLLELPPSTETLVLLVRGTVRHFLNAGTEAGHDAPEKWRLLLTSMVDDGEFARLLYTKIGDMIGGMFRTSLDQAVKSGEAMRVSGDPLNLFWFSHHTMLLVAATRLQAVPCLDYGGRSDLERQASEFILRGIGLNERAIDTHLTREFPPDLLGAAQNESACHDHHH